MRWLHRRTHEDALARNNAMWEARVLKLRRQLENEQRRARDLDERLRVSKKLYTNAAADLAELRASLRERAS